MARFVNEVVENTEPLRIERKRVKEKEFKRISGVFSSRTPKLWYEVEEESKKREEKKKTEEEKKVTRNEERKRKREDNMERLEAKKRIREENEHLVSAVVSLAVLIAISACKSAQQALIYAMACSMSVLAAGYVWTHATALWIKWNTHVV